VSLVKQITEKFSTSKTVPREVGAVPVFPVAHAVGIYPLEVAISTCIGQHVVVKTGRFSSKDGVIVSFMDRKFLVRIGDEIEAFPIEEIEPVVTQASCFEDKPSSPLSPPSPVPESVPVKVKPRRRGPKVNYVGRFVRIESGRYKGEAGYVTRGGNGYYSIKFSASSVNANETVMKRGADLTLVSRPEDFVEGSDFEKAVAEATVEMKKESLAISRRKRRNSIDSDNEDDSMKRRRRRGIETTRDYWMQRQVMVTSGKYRGEIGVVTRSGHGFYCVSIPGRGDVMKRATDLEIYDSQPDFSETGEDIGLDMSIPEQAKVRKAAFILMDIRRDGQVNESEEPENKHQRLTRHSKFISEQDDLDHLNHSDGRFF